MGIYVVKLTESEVAKHTLVIVAATATDAVKAAVDTAFGHRSESERMTQQRGAIVGRIGDFSPGTTGGQLFFDTGDVVAHQINVG